MRRQGGSTTVYLPGGQELTATGSAVRATRYYSFNGQVVAVRTGPGTTGVSTLVADHHGTAGLSINNTTRAVTRRYTDPYGAPRGTAPAAWVGDHGFLDKPVDDTGLVAIGARYYDPALGRFISVDPVMDLADPQQWHGYAYANNNPVTWSDPTGLAPQHDGGRPATTWYTPGYTPAMHGVRSHAQRVARRVPGHILTTYQVSPDPKGMVEDWKPSGVNGLAAKMLGKGGERLTHHEAEMLDSLDGFSLAAMNDMRGDAWTMANRLYPAVPGAVNPGQDDHNDAFRHAYWNALMTLYMGPEYAEEFATAHERLPEIDTLPEREAMDLYNNEVGRRIVTESAIVPAEADLAGLVSDAVESGSLLVLNANGHLAWSDQVRLGACGLPASAAGTIPGRDPALVARGSQP